MAETRHKTVIDVDLSTDRAEQALQRLQALADKFASTLTGYQAGGGGTPGQGGAAPNAAPGGGGGGGSAPSASTTTLPAPAPAPGASPGRGGAQGGGMALPAPVATPGGAPAPTAQPMTVQQGSFPALPGQAQPPAGQPTPPPPAPRADPRTGMAAGAAVGYAVQRYASNYMSAAYGESIAGISAASDTSVTAPFAYAGRQVEFQAARDAAGTRLGGMAGGAALGLAIGGPAGLAAGGALSAIADLFAQGQEKEAAEKAAALNAAGSSIAFRMGYVNRLADFRKQNSLLGVLGGGTSLGAGAGLGMMPEETVATMLSFGQSAGFLGSFRGQDVLGMSRSGVGVGAAGAFRGLAAAGAGGVGQVNPADYIGLARYSGLVGGKAEEYLGAIASATRGLAEKGLTLDVGATEQFLRRLSYSRASGLEQTRAVAGLTGALGGARQEFIAPYARVAQDAMMIEAMRMGGGDDLATMRAFETLSRDPESQRQAVVGATGGGHMATLGFLGMGGIGVDMASDLAGLSVGEVPTQRMRVAGGGGLASLRARHEAKMMATASEGAEGLMGAHYQIQERVMHLSTIMVTYNGLMDTLLNNMSELNSKVVKVLNEMR